MSNSAEFHKTLEALEQETHRLQDVSKAYARIAELAGEYEKVQDLLADNKAKMQQAFSVLEQQEKELQEKIHAMAELQVDDRKRLETLINHRIDVLNSSVEQLRKQNKDFYLDLEKTVKIKLDDNVAELKRLLEREHQKSNESVKKQLETQAEQASKRHRTTLWVLGSLLGLILILEVLSSFHII